MPAAIPPSSTPDALPADVIAPWTTRGATGGWLRWTLALVGLGLLGALVYQTGPVALIERVGALGWYAPLLLLPYAIASAFDAVGWQTAFARRPPPFWTLYLARMVGEALNNVTPTAYLGGEPVKAYLLHRFGFPLTDGTASVVVAKTTLTIAQIAFVIVGAALLLEQREAGWAALPILAALIAAGLVATAILIGWQRRGMVAFGARGIRRLLPRARLAGRLQARAGDVDERLRTYYETHAWAAVASVGWHFLGWVAGAAEVYLIMAFVGYPISWQQAVIVEALAQPIRLAGIIVPGTLGVQEAGGMLIYAVLGLPPELGLTTMLLKRAREITYSAVGIVLLARLRPRNAPLEASGEASPPGGKAS